MAQLSFGQTQYFLQLVQDLFFGKTEIFSRIIQNKLRGETMSNEMLSFSMGVVTFGFVIYACYMMYVSSKIKIHKKHKPTN